MLTDLPVDLFFHQLSYLPFRDVISVCSGNTLLHNYGLNPRFSIKWKVLTDRTFSNVNLSDLSRYNYLVYTQLINRLDPVSQLMIYYRQNDLRSWNKQKFTKQQRFLALFLLNKKIDILRYWLPSHHYQPFIDILNGQTVSKSNLNKMAREMAMQGNMKELLMMKERGADIHDDHEWALQLACREGRLSVVKFLTEQGANVGILDDYPLQLACRRGHLAVVKYLLEKGANINSYSALLEAARNGHLNVVKYFHEKGADIHARVDGIFRVTVVDGHLSVIKYLVEQGVDIHDSEDQALRSAARYGHLDVVQYLAEQGANIYAKDNEALRWSITDGYLEIVKYLMERGANHDIALQIALRHGNLEIIKYLESQQQTK